MQRRLFFSILFFVPFLLFSQGDTLVVSTLTWDSDTRSGNFVFPEVTDGPFEKILMSYNMRCHDAAVGNSEVGCREWDYSCNTFVTVPEMKDSILRTHPSHSISGFSEEVYQYSNSPVNAYTQYEQYVTNYSSVLSESTADIGDGEALFVFDQEDGVGKTQLLFTATELQAAGLTPGNITGLRLILQNTNEALNFLRLRMKSTTQSELNENTPELTAFTEVYFSNTGLIDGMNIFNFYAPFDWDGSSNLLLEISDFHSTDTDGFSVAATETAFTSVLNNSDKETALRFNGAGGIPIPNEPLNGISSEVTVSLWSKGDAAVMPANSTIFEAADADNARQMNVHLPWSDERVYWDCGNDGAGYDRIDKEANDVDYAGKWNHWAFTKNAETGVMKIFLNGELWHSGTGKVKLIDIEKFTLASSVTASNKYFGDICEVRIFDVALDESTIADWMRKPLDNTHPFYDNLVAYYPLQEGAGNVVQDFSLNGQTAMIQGGVDWQEVRGVDFFKDFTGQSNRPNITLVQGAYEQSIETVTVLDSVVAAQNEVITYEVDHQNNLIGVDTSYYWQGGFAFVYDVAGNIIDFFDVAVDGEIAISTLTYHEKKDAKLELLSMVTPYGNGLDLGEAGKTFTFDVTDFAPILKGERYLSVEFGAWQEELDIKFLFIRGTPPRAVISIQNIWPFARGWFQNILDDDVFEPREVSFNPDGVAFKIRSSITGHGQNGEFQQRNHYLNLGGGEQEFVYLVWKTCGLNPIYPQGGTWIYDRAGWCPGMATDLHEFDISDQVTPNGSTMMDYGVNGVFMSEANYLVSNQLVTYGAPNFSNDAAVESIIRPSNRVEYERQNPACNLPQIVIKNTGSQVLTSLEISYSVQGGSPLTYTWTGSLAFLETETIVLPVNNLDFWAGAEEHGVFEVTISQPNGNSDEYANNNQMISEFTPAKVFDVPALFLQLKTNNRGFENSYTIRNLYGDVILSRDGMGNNTTYKDDIVLIKGCYTLDVVDTGGDGLQFWANSGAGSGYVSFRRPINASASIPVKSFDSDFGNGVQFDFVVPETLGNKDIKRSQRFSVYPNPASDQVTIELTGYDYQDIEIRMLDLTGRVLKSEIITHYEHEDLHLFDLPNVVNGMYIIEVQCEDEVKVSSVVISK